MKTLDDLYRDNMDDLYKYLLRLSGHPQAAEDLVQDTFIKAYDHLAGYKGEKARPWLFRVAYNAYIDWYRREKRQVNTDPGLLASIYSGQAQDPEECYRLKESFSSWLKVVGSLPEKTRQVIVLRDYHCFTYQEISEILGISLTNVKVTLFRGRQKIKEVMEDGL